MPTNSRAAYLVNYLFLSGLIILAANDFIWKETYANWWTGKLSDLAGLLLLPLFLKYLTGWRNSVLILATALFFVWWKSPFSQPLLAVLNLQEWLYFQRIVDFSDLLALLILPLSWQALRRPEIFTFRLSDHVRANLTRYAVFPASLFFFVATSVDDFPEGNGSNEFCCAHEPVDQVVGNGRVYIPSAFTPDGDGLNDFFQIVADSNIVRIDAFRVFSIPDSILAFAADSLTDFSPQTGFDGSFFGEIISANYAFEIEVVAADGSRRRLRNRVCALPCPTVSPAPGPQFLSTCTFGSQLDSLGRFDRSVPSGEILDCF